MGYPSEPASEFRRHPLHSRLYRWTSATAEARGQSNLRRRLLSGLCGRVIEIGAGSGLNFPFYPTSTTEVVAVEPEPYLRQVARGAAGKAPVRVTVIGGIAERLPVPMPRSTQESSLSSCARSPTLDVPSGSSIA